MTTKYVISRCFNLDAKLSEKPEPAQEEIVVDPQHLLKPRIRRLQKLKFRDLSS
jgi:hypothetical protein